MQACWNKTRHSLFYIIYENGRLELYDILEDLQKPIVELQLSNTNLTTMAAHENGILLAVGDKNGNIFLTRSTESLGKFDRNERNNLIMVYPMKDINYYLSCFFLFSLLLFLRNKYWKSVYNFRRTLSGIR